MTVFHALASILTHEMSISFIHALFIRYSHMNPSLDSAKSYILEAKLNKS